MGACALQEAAYFHLHSNGVDFVFVDHPSYHRAGVLPRHGHAGTAIQTGSILLHTVPGPSSKVPPCSPQKVPYSDQRAQATHTSSRSGDALHKYLCHLHVGLWSTAPEGWGSVLPGMSPDGLSTACCWCRQSLPGQQWGVWRQSVQICALEPSCLRGATAAPYRRLQVYSMLMTQLLLVAKYEAPLAILL